MCVCVCGKGGGGACACLYKYADYKLLCLEIFPHKIFQLLKEECIFHFLQMKKNRKLYFEMQKCFAEWSLSDPICLYCLLHFFHHVVIFNETAVLYNGNPTQTPGEWPRPERSHPHHRWWGAWEKWRKVRGQVNHFTHHSDFMILSIFCFKVNNFTLKTKVWEK